MTTNEATPPHKGVRQIERRGIMDNKKRFMIRFTGDGMSKRTGWLTESQVLPQIDVIINRYRTVEDLRVEERVVVDASHKFGLPAVK